MNAIILSQLLKIATKYIVSHRVDVDFLLLSHNMSVLVHYAINIKEIVFKTLIVF